MRSSILTIAAALVFASAGARADTAFDAFKQICIESHADGDKALAIGDSLGWMPIPKAMLDQFPKGEFKDPRGRLRTTDDEFIMLVVGHGAPLFSPDTEIRVCAVAVLPTRAEGFDKQAADLAGVEKDASFSKTAFIWREENGKHIKVDRNSRDLKTYVANGNLNFLVTLGNAKISMVMLAVPGTTPAKP
ncbi:hypothetical protein [Rhizomicrobium electricum]|jgi:hypothetical protein|uniref:Uncharacterized protein n=1 Tax=Rhizomicrobium electricum TaxID=480070 RepID=A0ABN1EXW5_9PROT|nr:hypothetical protein [Rhizomicrobium electricum]NIJ49908.1 hypothetical protein [Rhizomicrobium electricum]